MSDIFHPGEVLVQERAGVREFAEKVGRGIRTKIPPIVADFLLKQPLVVISSVGKFGEVWVSPLTGPPGFIRSDDDQTVSIVSAPVRGDPLHEDLPVHPEIGLICVQFASGRRLRMNGTGAFASDRTLTVHVAQVYSNCQKYIQVRSFEGIDRSGEAPSIVSSERLDPDQVSLIHRSDTLFIGSFYAEGGADASHRGGAPGFVQVTSPTQLLIPDYKGNCMFQTLGNIAMNPSAGLLFFDFDSGRTLQISGEASIVWDAERTDRIRGAQRLLDFRIRQVRDTFGANHLRWHFVAPSRFNPG